MLNNDGYQGQLAALNTESKKFEAEKNLVSLIKANSKFNEIYLKRIGIMAQPGDKIKFRNKDQQKEIEVLIGKTGMYEIDNVNISQLAFVENSDSKAIIDYILIKKE